MKHLYALKRLSKLTILLVSVSAFLFAEEQNTNFGLVAEGSTFAPGQTFWLAARYDMNPGWHIYWEHSGDGGMPTSITWELPEGFQAGDIHWPAPISFIEADILVSFGYKDTVKLLVPITAPADLTPGETFTFTAHSEWLECKDICLPGEGSASITLTAGEPPPSSPAFEEVRRTIPTEIQGVEAHTRLLDNNRIRLFFSFPDNTLPEQGHAEFFPLNELTWELRPGFEINRVGNTLDVTGTLLSGTTTPEVLEGVFVFAEDMLSPGGHRAARVSVGSGEPGEESPRTETDGAMETRGLMGSLALAFFAGIAINLLPCIFPVLGLKISSFVEQAHGDPKVMKLHGLVFAAGILISLWILAAVVGALGAAWGAQFQDPRMVIGLLLVLTLFTMNLFGVFEMGASLTTVGGNLTQKQGYAGSFFQGVLLTVIATPCTGPVLAGMIGWMLTQPLWVGFLAFTSMGLGIALPYVVLAFSPKLAEKLPPPGMWMVNFKRGAAFLMVLFLWVLLYVLAGQVSPQATVRVAGAMMMVCFSAWVLGTWGEPARKPKVRRVAQTVTVLLLVFSTWLGFSYSEPVTEITSALQQRMDAGDPIRWDELTPELATELIHEGVPIHFQPWSQERMQSLRQEGHAVFVDFTADWCTICKINKFTTLHREEVMRAFQERGVVTLRADWTRRDDVIAEKLAKHGRRGVPVYLLYAEGTFSEPILLPEQLNPGIVMEALENL